MRDGFSQQKPNGILLGFELNNCRTESFLWVVKIGKGLENNAFF